MRRSSEPLFWSLFSAGGMIMAVLGPVLIVVGAYLVPADEVTFSRLHAIFTNFFARLGLIVLAFFTFMHGAHRLRHTLIEIGFKRFAQPIAVGSYLAALAGTAFAAVVAFS